MTVTFANRNHDAQVKVTLKSIGDDASFVVIGDDLLVTDGELIALCVLSPLDGYGWYEV
jgi:hypothetical protein